MKKITFTFLMFVSFFAVQQLQAQDFWQQLTPIPIQSNSTSVQCLATNSKGHIFAGVSSYPTDGVFRSIDGGQSWEQVLETSLYGATWPVYSITINEADHIYISTSGEELMRSEDNGETWETIQTPVDGWFYQILCIGLDTIYTCSGDGWDPIVYRTYDRGANWDVLPIYPEVTYTNEWATDMGITTDGVLYVGSIGYNPSYKGGLYRSFDWGNTWEHVAKEVVFIEQLAINSKGDVFMACGFGGGGYVLRLGASTAELLIEYTTYDIVVDQSDYIYAISLGIMSSYDNGETFGEIQKVPILNFHMGKDNFLYGYSYNYNRVYRSSFPVLEVDKKKMKDILIFPNPAADFLVIQLPDNKNEFVVSIYNILGNELLETIITNDSGIINISNLPLGIYMLKAETSTETFISKFIKK